MSRSGALTRIIEIQRRDDNAQDTTGQPIEVWRTLHKVYAAVRSEDVTERFQSDQYVGHSLRAFTIRWIEGIQFKDRIVYDGEIYNIRSKKEAEKRGRKVFMEILGETAGG